MSNYYDLYCVTCDKKADVFHWNHGDSQLRELAIGLREIEGLRKLSDLLSVAWIEVQLRGGEGLSWSAFVDFVEEHGKHNVRVRSEYGDVDGNCNTRFACPHCSHQQLCVLPGGHATPHQGREQ